MYKRQILCSGFDILINKLFLKRTIFPKSAIITGFILSGILDRGQPLVILAALCLVAVGSKYVLRVKGKHIFNPANIGLFVAVALQLPLVWTIESNIYLIMIVGLYLAYSYKKIPHIVGFLVVFIVFFGLLERSNPLQVLSWFFLFVMLIEPKTSGYGLWRGSAFGGIAGFVSVLAFHFLPNMDPFVSSLFVANLCNPVLDRFFIVKPKVIL